MWNDALLYAFRMKLLSFLFSRCYFVAVGNIILNAWCCIRIGSLPVINLCSNVNLFWPLLVSSFVTITDLILLN